MDAQQTPLATAPPMRVCELGLLPYAEALALQERLSARRQEEEIPDTLLLLEHPPTYTRGRRAGAGELPLGASFYRARGIEVFDTNRGGRVTYHGPGQLVGYPIMRVGDVGAFLRMMEAALIAALAQEGIGARSRCEEGPDYTGVWVGDRKIASIGVHVCRGVTTHGFALNLDNDLEPFSWITACGLPGVQMTSLAAEAPDGTRLDPAGFRRVVARELCAAHGARMQVVDASELRAPGSRGRRPRTHARGGTAGRADATQETTPDGSRAPALSGAQRS
jgi:lipoyl(octanoyl) transferase